MKRLSTTLLALIVLFGCSKDDTFVDPPLSIDGVYTSLRGSTASNHNWSIEIKDGRCNAIKCVHYPQDGGEVRTDYYIQEDILSLGQYPIYTYRFSAGLDLSTPPKEEIIYFGDLSITATFAENGRIDAMFSGELYMYGGMDGGEGCVWHHYNNHSTIILFRGVL